MFRWAIIVLLVLVQISAGAQASGQLLLSGQFPYSLGVERNHVRAGEQARLLVALENRGNNGGRQLTAAIALPPGLTLAAPQQGWTAAMQEGGQLLTYNVTLADGFDEWFDLIVLQVDGNLASAVYDIQLTAAGEQQRLPFTVAGSMDDEAGIAIAGIVFPLDRDGNADGRVSGSRLAMRDRSLDYYKNILRGRGAVNQEIEAVHPLAHFGIDIKNPGGIEKLTLVRTVLLDKNTRQEVAGLFTPGTTGEDHNAGSLSGTQGSLVAFVALTGQAEQRIELPLYADERLLSNGVYILQTQLLDGKTLPITNEIEIEIVKKDYNAILTVATACLAVLGGLAFAVRRLQHLFTAMKVRWLITIALYGAAAFVLVSIPASFLSDVFHILLGPFGILITGFFSSVVLYMLVASLVVIIPRPGAVGLMLTVRMLLGMVAFGHFSPVMLLSYGVSIVLLEVLLYISGVYRTGAAAVNGDRAAVRRMALVLAVVSAVADSAAMYTGLQAAALLYRLYYAQWYIWMLVVMNGCIYTMLGAFCGTALGRRLAKVGGD